MTLPTDFWDAVLFGAAIGLGMSITKFGLTVVSKILQHITR